MKEQSSACGAGQHREHGPRAWLSGPASGSWHHHRQGFCTEATTAPAPLPVLLCSQTRWQAAGLASSQICLTLPPFGFLIAEKFIRS